MKKYLAKNKGVIIFYALTIIVAFACTYRFNELKERDIAKTPIVYEEQLVMANK